LDRVNICFCLLLFFSNIAIIQFFKASWSNNSLMQSNMKKTLMQNYMRYENISIPQTTATDSQKYFIWPWGSNVFCYCIVFFKKICEAISKFNCL